MKNKVHILPPDIISKIAAGEIIERPASVVKELMENSIDAESTSIELHLKDAGKSLIHIKDNGSGIGKDDLETIFLRHATSKIQSLDDLFNIMSLGFRGEALYSVAAISDIILRSKTDAQESGWEIYLRGSEKQHIKPCAFNTKGTEIEIKELFFNTPARKNFLKTNSTEIHQVLDTFIPYTLYHKDIRFLLTHQGKTLVDVMPQENLVTRISEALNFDSKHLLEAEEDIPDRGCKVKVVLGDMNIRRPRRDMQFVFINGRPVFNKSISFHLNQVFRLILPPDFFPFFMIDLTIPADEVDVNIHPTKREVKIKDERGLCSLLRILCQNTLMSKGQSKQAVVADDDDDATGNNTISRALSASNPYERQPDSPPERLFDSSSSSASPRREVALEEYAYPRGGQTQEMFIPDDALNAQSQDSLQLKLEQARYIGSFINKFILFESGHSLLVVDQHAAAERITYEQLIRQMQNNNLEVQHLLAPVSIKLTPQEILVWEESKEKLKEMGLESTQWDDDTIAIHTYPQLIKDVEKAVRHLLAGENISKCDHDTIARRACRSSIMAGDKLNQQQAEYQREQLLQCLDPFTCPHGRPTVIEMSEGFLDKQFLRT